MQIVDLVASYSVYRLLSCHIHRCSAAPAAAAAAWEISIFMLRGYTDVSAPRLSVA